MKASSNKEGSVQPNVQIKSILQKTFKAIVAFGEVTKGECSLSILEEEGNGNYFRKFDSEGNLLEKEYFNWVGNWVRKYLIQYNENRKRQSIDNYLQVDEKYKLLSKIVYNYDALGLLHSAEIYKPSGLLKTKTIYKYNELGLKEESSELDTTGKIKSKKTFEYDSKEREIKSTLFYGRDLISENPTKEVEILFDIQGWDKIVKEKHGRYFNTITKTYKHKVRTSYYIDKLLTKKSIEISPNVATDEYGFEYQMDMNNNWVERITLKNTIPIEISERAIEYTATP